MSRISDSASHSSLIQNMLRTQTRLRDWNLKVSTGKEAQLYSGIADQSERLVSVENSRELLNRYINNNKINDLRLDLAFTAVEAAQTTVRDFKNALSTFNSKDSYSQDDVERIQDWAYKALVDMESYLNSQADGRYLFAGGRERTAPVDFGLTNINDFKDKYDGLAKTYATTRDAHLSDLFHDEDTNAAHKQHVDGSNWMIFRRDDDGETGTSGSSTIEATSGMFSGYKAGSQITIAGTASNNGTYTIESVNDDGNKITIKTEMLTDESTPTSITTEATVTTGLTITRQSDSAQISSTDTGDVDFTAPNIIDVTTAASTASLAEGDVITIAGSASNNKTFTVLSRNATTGDLTVKQHADTKFTLADGSEVTSATTGAVTFDRANSTITATNASFSDASVGETITVANTTSNNGTYTITSISADKKQVTVESTKLTDEGLSSGDTYFDMNFGTRTFVDVSDRKIHAQTGGGADIPGAYSDLQVGDSVVIAGTAGHDNTYTVESIATDGSWFTVEASPALGGSDEADTNGTTITVSDRNFIYTTGTELVLADAGANDTITIQRQDGGGVDTKAFEGLRAGMYFTLAGAPTAANNTTYLIQSVDAATGKITLDSSTQIDTAEETDAAAGTVKVFAADGSISTDSYYNGDQQTRTYRVDESRTYDMDITAADAAFEKAIRAMGIIAQGEWGTEGGLDQNRDRVDDALYLLNDALNHPAEGDPPFGTEENSDLDTVTFQLGIKQNLLADASTIHTETMARLDSWIADIENADPLEAITNLLDEQRSLETSYQTLSRVLNLSLVDFL